jgi:heme-degrading monooxygenase HmoA
MKQVRDMYMVISRWDAGPKGHDEFVKRAMVVREAACKMPGVVEARGFVSEEGTAVIVLVFEDENAYQNLYAKPDSPFAKAIEEQRIDMVGRWLGSERGELIP